MPEQARQRVEITEFSGWLEDAEELDLPPGAAAVQINATCVEPGKLIVRGGLREVTFET